MMENHKYCPHNRMIDCHTYECMKCGWNPEVKEKRILAIQKELDANREAQSGE